MNAPLKEPYYAGGTYEFFASLAEEIASHTQGIDLLTAVDVRLCTEDSYFCIKDLACHAAHGSTEGPLGGLFKGSECVAR